MEDESDWFKEYSELLDSWQWKEYRRAVLSIKGHACEMCGFEGGGPVPLQIHHVRYINGLKPWQYDNPDDIQVLCGLCHTKVHGKRTFDPDYKYLVRGDGLMQISDYIEKVYRNALIAAEVKNKNAQ